MQKSTKEVIMKQQGSSASKKQKVDNNEKDEKLQHEELLIRPNCVLLDPIQPSILRQIDEFKDSYLQSHPFQHCCIRNFCVDGFLEQVLDEVKQNSKVKFKESDLFRMYQSVDLGNLKEDSELASKMPTLMQLKHALYSNDFRSFMEQLTNLEPGTLIDKIDCAVNCHTTGCHLLCHDDVIGTRKISYILYLTDPTTPWRDEQGGMLELYESTIKDDDDTNQTSKRSKRVPAVFPCKTLLPTFNSLVLFVVTPGQSFHSVQEVLGDSPRLSIQGWYHSRTAPSNSDEATLCSLKTMGKEEETEGEFLPFSNATAATAAASSVPIGSSSTTSQENGNDMKRLGEQDREYLAPYINDIYLSESSIKEIRERFEEDSSIQLRNFLKDDYAKLIQSAALMQDKKDKREREKNDKSLNNYTIGVSSEWIPVGPAHKQRFLEYVGSETSEGTSNPGGLLQYLKHKLFLSLPFRRYMSCLSSLEEATGYRGRIRRFRPGLDYTVAHYGILTSTSVLDVTLCFASGHGKGQNNDDDYDDDALWESGDVGGFECYIEADDSEKEEPEEEYDDEGDTELLSVAVSNNTLSLVFRDPGTLHFVKYVGSQAPSSRWDISLEYEIPEDNEGK